jgi:hypothetical protein
VIGIPSGHDGHGDHPGDTLAKYEAVYADVISVTPELLRGWQPNPDIANLQISRARAIVPPYTRLQLHSRQCVM